MLKKTYTHIKVNRSAVSVSAPKSMHGNIFNVNRVKPLEEVFFPFDRPHGCIFDENLGTILLDCGISCKAVNASAASFSAEQPDDS